ncbi:hypothetical protein A9Q81_16620 [Gammaproteobacteria bacterium 42_54_T18]|nr:hypothetical protein A9Q81_16620 [Gammaproteobacteria bacterium 42_54_T18]
MLPGLTFFNGKETYLYGKGSLHIGQNTYCGSRCGIYVAQGYTCRIGSNTAISHNVRIYTSNRNPNDIINSQPFTSEIFGDVVIGDNCWIGANVFISQGIEIGDNVVIGANSVVSKSIASYSIAVGAPIKVIKKGMLHK